MSRWLCRLFVLFVCFTVNSCSNENEEKNISPEFNISANMRWGDPKICIVYGSGTGNTASIASKIKDKIQAKTEIIVDIRDIRFYDSNAYVFAVSDYDILILGTSTLAGDMFEDWRYVIKDFLRVVKNNRQFAFFGVGCRAFGDNDYNKGIEKLEEEVLNNNFNLQNLYTTFKVDFCCDDDQECNYDQAVDEWVTELVKRF